MSSNQTMGKLAEAYRLITSMDASGICGSVPSGMVSCPRVVSDVKGYIFSALQDMESDIDAQYAILHGIVKGIYVKFIESILIGSLILITLLKFGWGVIVSDLERLWEKFLR